MQLLNARQNNDGIEKIYLSHDHEVKIYTDVLGEIAVKCKYLGKENNIPAYLVPGITFFGGRFSCDLSLLTMASVDYPDDVDKLRRGLILTAELVEDIRKTLKTEWGWEV